MIVLLCWHNRKRTSINPSSLAVAQLCPLLPSPHRPAPPPALQGDGSNLLEEFIAHPDVKVMPAVHQYETHPLNVMEAMSAVCRGAGELGRWASPPCATTLARPLLARPAPS